MMNLLKKINLRILELEKEANFLAEEKNKYWALHHKGIHFTEINGLKSTSKELAEARHLLEFSVLNTIQELKNLIGE